MSKHSMTNGLDVASISRPKVEFRDPPDNASDIGVSDYVPYGPQVYTDYQKQIEDDEDHFSDNEDDGSSKEASLEDRKNQLIDDIAKDMKSNGARVKLEQYRSEVGEILRLESSSQNILNWIAMGMRWRNNTKWQLQASLELAEMVLDAQPKLIHTPKDESGDTPLHVALSHESLGELAQRLYIVLYRAKKISPLRTAIRTQNNNEGLTCIHIAVMRGLTIANELIKIAIPDDLKIARKNKKGSGNTPLHDAVDFQHCLCNAEKKNEALGLTRCTDCDDVGFQQRRIQIMSRISQLVTAQKDVLKQKNDADMTPYMYHLDSRTLEQHQYIPQTSGVWSRATSEENHAGRSIVHGSYSRRGSHYAAAQPHRPSEVESPALDLPKGIKNEEPAVSVVSQDVEGSMPSPVGVPPTATMEGHKPRSRCYQQAIRIAKEIEEYLFESSLTIGGFEEACQCFFGRRPANDRREPNFRPGTEITPSDLEHYDKVVYCTDILAQVELVLASLPPRPLDISPDVRKQENMSLWEDNELVVQGIFKMLSRKGAKKILKLTIKDNPEAPCSDEVIEKCLAQFDVRYFDWQKVDLCAEVVLSAAPNIVELTLYSSGSHSVLQSWASQRALCELNKLKSLTIDARDWKRLGSYDRYIRNLNNFIGDLCKDMELYRTKLYLAFAKVSVESFKAHAQRDQKATEDELASLQNEPAQKNRAQKMQKIEKKLQGIAKLTEDHRKKMENFENELQKLEEQQRSIEEVRRARRREVSSTPNNYQTKQNRVITKMESGRLPELFLATGGFVAGRFEIQLYTDERPETNKLDKAVLDELPHEPEKEIHRWIDSIKEFVNRYVEGKETSPKRRIRVALIDDGVDVNIESLSGRIHSPGWPRQTPTDRILPWYKSATGHGTDMARMIRMVCPHIELYVAKIGQWANGNEMRVSALENESTANIAAEAMKWAIEEKVDVISMSWNLIRTKSNKNAINRLNDEVQKAAKDGIIMFCAAADKSIYGTRDNLYPGNSDTKLIKTVGSADSSGWASSFVHPDQVDYLFPGQQISELKSGQGSSAATALAAGFAALILWVFAKEAKSPGMETVKDPVKMFKIFDTIQEKKFVDVTALIRDGRQVDPRAVMLKCRSYLSQMQ